METLPKVSQHVQEKHQIMENELDDKQDGKLPAEEQGGTFRLNTHYVFFF